MTAHVRLARSWSATTATPWVEGRQQLLVVARALAQADGVEARLQWLVVVDGEVEGRQLQLQERVRVQAGEWQHVALALRRHSKSLSRSAMTSCVAIGLAPEPRSGCLFVSCLSCIARVSCHGS